MKLYADVDGDGTNEYEYIVKLAQSITINPREDSTTLPLPGTSADNSIIQSFQGETEEISINFVIYNDGTDKSNSTAPTGVYTDDTVETIQEQVDFLKKYIKQVNISTEHQFEGYPLNSTVTGKITEISFDTNANNPNHIPCSIRFVIGNVI